MDDEPQVVIEDIAPGAGGDRLARQQFADRRQQHVGADDGAGIVGRRDGDGQTQLAGRRHRVGADGDRGSPRRQGRPVPWPPARVVARLAAVAAGKERAVGGMEPPGRAALAVRAGTDAAHRVVGAPRHVERFAPGSPVADALQETAVGAPRIKPVDMGGGRQRPVEEMHLAGQVACHLGCRLGGGGVEQRAGGRGEGDHRQPVVEDGFVMGRGAPRQQAHLLAGGPGGEPRPLLVRKPHERQRDAQQQRPR